MNNPTERACSFGVWSGKPHKWLSNWEIKIWLGDVVNSVDGMTINAKKYASQISCLHHHGLSNIAIDEELGG
jgi:hypothetical protein